MNPIHQLLDLWLIFTSIWMIIALNKLGASGRSGSIWNLAIVGVLAFAISHLSAIVIFENTPDTIALRLVHLFVVVGSLAGITVLIRFLRRLAREMALS